MSVEQVINIKVEKNEFQCSGRKTGLKAEDSAIFFKTQKEMKIFRQGECLVFEGLNAVTDADTFMTAVKYMAAATGLAYYLAADNDSEIVAVFIRP